MYEDIINEILNKEGGFINHPSDKGGATNFGITQKTLEAYIKKPVSIEDVEKLSKQEAYNIYEDIYINKPKFYLIDDPLLKELVIDSGVHSGTHRATVWLQEVAKVKVDGIIGNITLNAVNSSKSLFIPYFNKRMIFLAELITRDSKQAVFAHGWYNRLAYFLDRYNK